jgi:hypothetical protein
MVHVGKRLGSCRYVILYWVSSAVMRGLAIEQLYLNVITAPLTELNLSFRQHFIQLFIPPNSVLLLA